MPEDRRDGGRVSPKTSHAYASIGALRMYYEQAGQGRPVLLLHAGMSTIETSFPVLRDRLATRYATVAPEQQAHGHTADLERPLRYEQMVDDTAGLLRSLQLDAVDVFGWSDGGIVALGLAARHPQLVRKLAIIGAGYSNDAEKPDFKPRMEKLSPDNEHIAPFRRAYEEVAPTPAAWSTLIAKEKAMYFAFEGWSEAAMKQLAAPLLVMLGDQDFTRIEHAVQLFQMVPHGRLAVLPASDHAAPVERVDWVESMLVDFFEAPMPDPSASKE